MLIEFSGALLKCCLLPSNTRLDKEGLFRKEVGPVHSRELRCARPSRKQLSSMRFNVHIAYHKYNLIQQS